MITGGVMKNPKERASIADGLHSMSVDELWDLHKDVCSLLTEKLTAEKLDLENRLVQLNQAALDQHANIAHDAPRIVRRPYPKVFPKYRNPDDTSETWSGRGRLPRWLDAKLKLGMKMEAFLINPHNSNKAKKR